MIGVGIITCNRPDFFVKCFRSIPKDKVDLIVVVNDGDESVKDLLTEEELEGVKIFQSKPSKHGVGPCKNAALKQLYAAGCDHLFIIEDDIIVTDPIVFDKYIEASNETGIKHFMFGYHGPANKQNISKGPPTPKHKIKYNKTTIALNQHCVGAFCYYHKDCISQVGYLDTVYHNAFEHIDHSYRIAKAGLTTPYWNWADINCSWFYLDELACSEENSSIRNRDDWQENIKTGYSRFKEIHNYTPFGENSVPDVTLDEVKLILKNIHEKYSNRN